MPEIRDSKRPEAVVTSTEHGRRLVGHAAWYAPATDVGVVQLVDLSIADADRRQGHASALLGEVIAQSRALCRQRGVPFRRLWVAVEQKSQVLARAFLTRHGFHHTATIPELMKKQDLLVYVKSLD